MSYKTSLGMLVLNFSQRGCPRANILLMCDFSSNHMCRPLALNFLMGF